mmetsp:Transcript_15666/g.39056  ORF Transcript_15666/g.39056 Transcript_15666/m.39056 type:complete len:106 (-) Transcript_15666:462-779(-)
MLHFAFFFRVRPHTDESRYGGDFDLRSHMHEHGIKLQSTWYSTLIHFTNPTGTPKVTNSTNASFLSFRKGPKSISGPIHPSKPTYGNSTQSSSSSPNVDSPEYCM